MKRLIVTGMGRSGTTLLGKLLSSHKSVQVLAQPLPLLFVEVKRLFLESIGTDQYYVLNDDIVSRRYKDAHWQKYLENVSLSPTVIATLFHRMQSYSGQCTKGDFKHFDDSDVQPGFKNILEKCLDFFLTEPGLTYLGNKEIMCEEFLPYLCTADYKCIVIIRDPRDVLASANYPQDRKYLGEKRPSLFVLRTWRKSIEQVYLLRKHKNLHFLRYEDLVDHPYSELDRLTAFLGVDDFPDGYFDQGIQDGDGKEWSANSSFGNEDAFISQKSRGIFREVLSTEEIDYTEAICQHEMNWLSYTREFNSDPARSIRNFKDVGIARNDHVPVNFSSQAENIASEIERLESFSKFYHEDWQRTDAWQFDP